MKKIHKLFAVAALIFICCAAVSCKVKSAEKTAGSEAAPQEVEDLDAQYGAKLLAKGTPAPAFTLKDPTGMDISLDDFKGKYVVIDFWATWCPDCRKEIPVLKELKAKHASDKIAFVSVSFDTDMDQWTGYIEENNLDWCHVSPMKKWKETQISSDYNVNWIPTMYLLDPDGKVILGTVVIGKIAKALSGIDGK